MCDVDFCDVWSWGLSQILNNIEKNLAITFNKFYISICIIKFWINGEMFDSIALAVFEI